jgi:hypothetical protein
MNVYQYSPSKLTGRMVVTPVSIKRMVTREQHQNVLRNFMRILARESNNYEKNKPIQTEHSPQLFLNSEGGEMDVRDIQILCFSI